MTRRRLRGDDGSVMPMAVILVAFLMLGACALISASQQWASRRDAYATAAAAARAGAQTDPDTLRAGTVLDPDRAAARAQAILTAANTAGSVTVDNATVTVHVTITVAYAFPSPGFPDRVTGHATATVRRGVTGREPGG